MVSCKDLQKSIINRDYARFWLDFSESEQVDIEAFLASKNATPEICERIRHIQNLEMLPLGMAPNFDGLEKLYQYFAVQDARIDIINFNDVVSDSANDIQHDAESLIIENRNIAKQLSDIKQEISENITSSINSAASQEFSDLLISKLENRMHLMLVSLKNVSDYDIRVLKQAFIGQSIQVIYDYFLMQNVDDSSFIARFIFKGYLIAKVKDVIFFAYGLPSRSVFLEEIVFGPSSKLELHDLGCDIIIEHANSMLSDIYFDEKSAFNISVRASDTLKLLFSTDEEYRKISNFMPLAKIPCYVEISFSKPRQNLPSNDAELSKRIKSRIWRVYKLIEQLHSAAGENIFSIDLSNVSSAVDKEILNLISTCKNLQKFNISNTGVSDADFADCQILPHLKKLNIEGMQINENGFNLLTLFPNLRELNSAGASGIIKLLSKRDPAPSLIKLDVSSNVLNTDSEGHLPKLKFLHSLIANNCDFSDSLFEFIERLPALEGIELRNCNFTSNSIYHLSQKGKNINYLDISLDKSDMSLVADDFQSISMMTNLKKLKLSKRLITDSLIRNMSVNMKKLKVLDVSYTMISNISINYLVDMRNLEELDFTGCRNINDSGISILCESTLNLKKLSIKGTSITKLGIDKIVNRYPNIKLDYQIN